MFRDGTMVQSRLFNCSRFVTREDTATITGHDLLSRRPGRMLQGIANVALVHRNIILVRVHLQVFETESCRFFPHDLAPRVFLSHKNCRLLRR